MLHWNGSSWTGMAVDAPGQGIPNQLTAVSSSGTGEAWVAGFSGGITTLLAAPVPVVPSLSGDLVGQANATLATFGFTGATPLNYTLNCPASQSGLVVSSDPAAGQIAPVELAVSLTVCATPATATVPNVLTADDFSARNAITAAGLTVGHISMDNRCLAEAGTVLTQNPSGGTQAQPGSSVSLTESSGRNSRGKPCVSQA